MCETQYVCAIYDFESQDASTLSFKKGDHIKVLERQESGWWNGLINNTRGWFPRDRVTSVQDEKELKEIIAKFSTLSHVSTPGSFESQDGAQSSQSTHVDCVSPQDIPVKALSPDIGRDTSTFATNASPQKLPGKDLTVITKIQSDSEFSPNTASTMPLTAVTSEAKNIIGIDSTDITPQQTLLKDSSGDDSSEDLPSYWEPRRTIDNRTYYCNLLTDETSWSVSKDAKLTVTTRKRSSTNASITSKEDRRSSHNSSSSTETVVTEDSSTLVRAFLVRLQHQNANKGAKPSKYHRRNSSRNLNGLVSSAPATGTLSNEGSTNSSALNLESLNTFADFSFDNGKGDDTLTWDRLAASVTMCAHQLQSAIQKETKEEYLPLTSKIISAVRRLLLSSSGGGLGRDAPVFRTHRLLRAHHRQITNSICAISLSAKIASSVWPPPNSHRIVKEDVAALVRSVRQFMIEAENCGVTLCPPKVEEEMLTFLPGIVPNDAFTPAVPNNLANSDNNEGHRQTNSWDRPQTGHTANSVPHSAVGESGWHDGLTVPSLFEADPEAQMRLRQQLAEHRTSVIKNQSTPSVNNIVNGPTNKSASMLAESVNDAQKMVDISPQLEDGARELARSLLLFQRFLARRETGRREGTESLGQRKNSTDATKSASTSDSSQPRMSHNSRLIAYAKLVISELAQFLLVIDDLERFEPIVLNEKEKSFPKEGGEDKLPYASTLVSQSEIAQASTLAALRDARLEVSHDVGLLVVATQTFSQIAARIPVVEVGASGNASDANLVLQDSALDREYIHAIGQISDALHAVDSSTLKLWLSSKRVLEARDIIELHALWNRIAQYHVPTNTLAPLPIGPKVVATPPGESTDSGDLSRRGSADITGTYFRRSMSLPYMKHRSLMASSSESPNAHASSAATRRIRAESSEQGLPPLPYIGGAPPIVPRLPGQHESTVRAHNSEPPADRRGSTISMLSTAAHDTDTDAGTMGSAKENRFGDKLKKFFFEDAANKLSSSSKRNGHTNKSSSRSTKRTSIYSIYTAASGKSNQSNNASAVPVADKSNRSSLIIETPPSNQMTETSSYTSMSSMHGVNGPIVQPPLSPLSPGSNNTPTKVKAFFGEEPPPPPTISASASLSRENSVSSGAEKKLWFLQYDYSPQDLLLTVDGTVKGGTLPSLIERLTAHDFYDTKYVQSFLLTYHSFCTTPEFFEELFHRFKIQPPAGLRQDEMTIWTEKKLKPIRLRVYNILKQWLEQHYVEKVPGDPLALEMLQDFSYTYMAEAMPKAAEQILQLIERRRQSEGGFRKLVRNLPTSAPEPIVPRSFRKLKLLDISPIELARQLTLIDSQLFNKIRSIECLKKAWSRSPNDPDACNGLNCTIASNIQAMSVMSTQLTLWVSSVILQETEVKKRANVMRYFVTLADCCRQLNNFNSVMSILGSLLSTSIDRLSRTRQALNTRSLQVLQELRDLMQSDRNFHTYRTAVHSVNPPAIPFIGINRQDLTFIDDGNEDVLSSHRHLINFSKCIKTADTILELQGFQNVPYALTPVPEIRDWLMKQLEEFLPHSDNPEPLFDKFFQVSRILEPKERDDEKFIRLLQESGFL